MNKIFLTGRLTKDAELRFIPGSNTPVVTFSIATDRFPKPQNGPDADFNKCTKIGKGMDKLAPYLVKGLKVAVIGQLRDNNYTDKDGKKVYGKEIFVEELDLMQKAQQQAPVGFNGAEPTYEEYNYGNQDEDVPF